MSKAREITGVLNDFSFNAKKVAGEMLLEHKTLQQSFTRLCVEWLRTLAAAEDWRFDGRNEASQKVAKILMEGHDDLPGLPLI